MKKLKREKCIKKQQLQEQEIDKTMLFHNHEEVERDGVWFQFIEQDN